MEAEIQKGIAEFNCHRWWHAHEHWEQVWKRMDPSDRAGLQALIQVCGVFFHLQRGRVRPAKSLAQRARELLGQSRPPNLVEVEGVEVFLAEFLSAFEGDALLGDIDEWLSRGANLKARTGQ